MNRSQAFSQVATVAGYLLPSSESAKASSSVSAASAWARCRSGAAPRRPSSGPRRTRTASPGGSDARCRSARWSAARSPRSLRPVRRSGHAQRRKVVPLAPPRRARAHHDRDHEDHFHCGVELPQSGAVEPTTAPDCSLLCLSRCCGTGSPGPGCRCPARSGTGRTRGRPRWSSRSRRAPNTDSLICFLTDLHAHVGTEKITLIWDGQRPSMVAAGLAAAV